MDGGKRMASNWEVVLTPFLNKPKQKAFGHKGILYQLFLTKATFMPINEASEAFIRTALNATLLAHSTV